MDVSHSELATPEQLQDLEKLKTVIQRAVADGKVSQQEIETIKKMMSADGKVTCDELKLYRDLILDKIEQGELEYDW